MPPPRPPSRVDPISFPVFAIDWFGNPGDGTSIVAYCGGGGSAKTGVNNSLVIIHNEALPHQISTGDAVGVALKIYQNPQTGKIWLLVGLGNHTRRYSMPEGTFEGEIDVGESVNALAVNVMGNRFAVGCDSGTIKVYEMRDESLESQPLYTITEGHEKTVCGLFFSARGNRLLSSAKDGTACVFQEDQLLSKLKCDVHDPKEAPPKRATQILVRGCAFGDLDGRLAYTVASPRRGKAYLGRWSLQKNGEYTLLDRIECCNCPISAMSLSQDGGLLVLGSTDGSIILWSTEDWKPLKIISELHELPVTCIASRPFPVPLRGEDDGVTIHARSASADSKMGCLTLQRRGAKKAASGSSTTGVMKQLHRLIMVLLLALLLSPILNEASYKCKGVWNREGVTAWRRCVMDEVIIAPSWKPGIGTPPY